MRNLGIIKSNLTIVTSLVIFFLILIGAYTYRSFRNVTRLNQLTESLNFIDEKARELRKNENEFMLGDLYDVNYFKTRHSKNLCSVKINLKGIYHSLDSLKNNKDISRFKLNADISKLFGEFYLYNEKLQIIEEEIFKKGYIDYGLIGKFRVNIHKAEEIIKHLKNQDDLMLHLLMLRRHEKDYFQRKDTVYVEKFKVEYQSFLTDINRKTFLSDAQKNELILLFDDYQKTFIKVVSIDKLIGLKEDFGLTKELNDAANDIQPVLLRMRNVVKENTRIDIYDCPLKYYYLNSKPARTF